MSRQHRKQSGIEERTRNASKSQYDRRMDEMERDYSDALDRLIQGIPRNTVLRANLTAGKSYKINVANVAKEAGHSRTPLYEHYPHILERIEKAKNPPKQATKVATAQDKITELRSDKSVLQREKRDALTENMGLLVRLKNLEEKNERLKREVDRLTRRERNVSRLRIVGEDDNQPAP